METCKSGFGGGNSEALTRECLDQRHTNEEWASYDAASQQPVCSISIIFHSFIIGLFV
jgi:hypothetical protein